MGMSPSEFRSRCQFLVHFAPAAFFRPEAGLLTASQVLERSADAAGNVYARFLDDHQYTRYPVDHWKRHSRFRRRAGERGSNLLVRDRDAPANCYFLGNNYPLGDGTCIGTKLRLTDNRPGDSEPTREEWFETLNRMFWVFPEPHLNPGFLAHVGAVNGALIRVRLATRGIPDDLLAEKVRISAINGGGSNGARPRGTATYKSISEWSGRWPPKEIGLRDGLSFEVCEVLVREGHLSFEAIT